MIKAHILTDFGEYEVKLPTFDSLWGAYNCVKEQLAEGLPFEGPNELLEIKGDIKHIRVFIDDEQPTAPEKPKPATVDVSKPGKFTATLDYLGNKITVAGIYRNVVGVPGKENPASITTILFPVEAGNLPALEVFDPPLLSRLLNEWAANVYGHGNYLVIVPPAPVTHPEEIADYLDEYLDTLRAENPVEVANKTAKAFRFRKE